MIKCEECNEEAIGKYIIMRGGKSLRVCKACYDAYTHKSFLNNFVFCEYCIAPVPKYPVKEMYENLFSIDAKLVCKSCYNKIKEERKNEYKAKTSKEV